MDTGKNNLTALLNASIAYEDNKKIRPSGALMVQSAEEFLADQQAAERLLAELSATRKQLDRVNTQNVIMAQRLSVHLDEIEASFDNDEKFQSPEAAQDYLDSAKWMADNFSRNDHRRIDRVQYWLDHYLPY